MTSWCILQVSSSSTLCLAKSLAEAGFTVWTPTETVKGEAHKPKEFEPPRPPRKVPDQVTRPLVKGIVFARADHLAELMALSHAPVPTYQVWDTDLKRMVTKGHPYFRVFRPEARPIPDRELDALRRIAAKRKPAAVTKTFKVGAAVKLTEGAYGGLRGHVVEVRNKSDVTVRLEGSSMSFTVKGWLLTALEEEAVDAPTDSGVSSTHIAKRALRHRNAA